MKCACCGKDINDDSKFCNYCGNLVEKIILNESKNKYTDVEVPENDTISEVCDTQYATRNLSVKDIRKSVLKKKITMSCIIIVVCVLSGFVFLNRKPATIKVSESKDMLLFNAVSENNTEKARTLINEGVNINLVSPDGNNALMLAVKNENLEIAQEILKKGGELDAKNNDGDTALLIALKNRNVELSKLLITSKANVNIVDKIGDTPLHLGVKYFDSELTEMLINYGAQVEYFNNALDTPLLIALKLNKIDIVGVLLKNGADISIEDINKESALQIAIRSKNVDFFNQLALTNKDLVYNILMQEKEMNDKAMYPYIPEYIRVIIKSNDIIDFFTQDGKKILLDKDGVKRYEGEIKQGKINGFGIAYNKEDKYNFGEQILYKGNWKDGLWDGSGQSYWIKCKKELIIEANPGITSQRLEEIFNSEKNTVCYDTTYINGYRNGKYTRYYSDGRLNDTGTVTNGVNNSNKYGDYNAPIKKSPTIGMSAKEVEESAWGKPSKINKTTTKYGVSEQWVYSGYRYIYLENGVVTSIQESN
jgi:ankyrin repeat protein